MNINEQQNHVGLLLLHKLDKATAKMKKILAHFFNSLFFLHVYPSINMLDLGINIIDIINNVTLGECS